MAVNDDKAPPVIPTEYGPVTESMRRQAEINMRLDPKRRAEWIAMFGEERLRRDFPGAFEDETPNPEGTVAPKAT
jgi:hypothetical protein